MKCYVKKIVLIVLVCVLGLAKSFAETEPVSFTALDGNASIRLDKKLFNRFRSIISTVSLSYSTDGENWKTFKINKSYNIAKGDTLFLRATNKNYLFSNPIAFYNFNISGAKVAADGDITTLLNANGTDKVPAHSFYGLFQNCTNLVKAPKLTATSLGKLCYDYMFNGCTSLVEITLGSAALDASMTLKWMNGVPAGCTVKCPLDLDAASLKGTILPSDCVIEYTVDGEYNENDGVSVSKDNNLPCYTRKMSNAWGTIVLPFSINYSQENGNYKLYYLSGFSGKTPAYTEYADGQIIKAGTPMVVKAVGELVNSKYTINIVSIDNTTSTTINPQDNTTINDFVDGWAMDGTFKNNTEKLGVYYIAKNKLLYANITTPFGAYRAWFNGSFSSSSKTSSFDVEDDATAINNVNAEETKSSDAIYNLSGVLVENSQKGQIIIVNGKKVLVK